MKSLIDYIKEAREEKVAASKSFSIDLSMFDDQCEDLLKSAQDIADKEGFEIETEDNKVSVKVSKENIDKVNGLFEMLQDFLNARSQDTKAASDESYAQKVKALQNKVSEFFDYAEEVNADALEKDTDKEKDAHKEKEEE